jgi:diguanylate cyclase (GGDEF)-like protein
MPPAEGSDGFDGTIVGEITRSALRSFLSSAPAPRADSATPSRAPAAHPPAAAPASAPPPPLPPPRPDAPATASAAPTTGPLGDVDLVDAVMSDPDGVARTAMALLREQTGWPDAELLPADRAAPPGAAAAPVRSGDGPALQLVTARAASREVAPWAEWLAKWLALDRAYRAYRLMAFRDELTGTWNRRYLMDFLAGTIADARARRRTVTVMVFDIDNFKLFNDEFGHESGDVILRETVALLHSVIRAGDRVCRIGGDEFAVVFGDPSEPRESGSTHPSSVAQIVRRFQEQVCRMRFPKLGIEAPGNLTISAGLAAFPWDGSDPESLLRLADRRALESKRRGKDHITFGPDAAGADRS